MTLPRWLADEMVGRLARYLRFVGCDTEYARGLPDEEIVERARREDRVLLTRDRALAARCPGSLLLTSPNLEDQWRTVRAAYPELPTTVAFRRCTECNGRLEPFTPAPGAPRDERIPWDRVAGGLPLYRCANCGHVYWEGTHTAGIRDRLRAWTPGAPG